MKSTLALVVLTFALIGCNTERTETHSLSRFIASEYGTAQHDIGLVKVLTDMERIGAFVVSTGRADRYGLHDTVIKVKRYGNGGNGDEIYALVFNDKDILVQFYKTDTEN